MHVALSPFTVRSYEVDSYGHLNNGVFVSWFEQGRLDYLTSLGDFSYDGFAERQQWLVVARTEVDFRRPLRVGDRVALVSRVAELGHSSVRFRQALHAWPEGGRDGGGSGLGAPGSAAAPAAPGNVGAATGSAPGAAAALVRAAEQRPLVAEALTVMVFHGPDGRSTPIPPDFRSAVEDAQ